MTQNALSYFTPEQITLLLKPIHPQRVLQLKGMSYVEGYDIRAELNRVFGFARWSQEITSQELVCETEVKTNAGKPAWYVVYRTTLRLRVEAPDGNPLSYWDGSHVGESTHPVRGEAHGNALTNSETYALRRCAINLGDQFGLSLYNKGSLEPVVRWTLVRPEDEPHAADTDDVPQVNPEGSGEQREEPRVSRARSALAARKEEIQDFFQAAADAQDVTQLREVWKAAGAAGRLQDPGADPGTGDKLTVQEYLYRRSDELMLPKSADDPEAAAGGELAGEQ